MGRTLIGGVAAVFLVLAITPFFGGRAILVWKLSILATEWGHGLAAGALVWLAVARWAWPRRAARAAVTGILLASTGFFLWPVFQAWREEGAWRAAVESVFGPAAGRSLSFRRLWVPEGRSTLPERLAVQTPGGEALLIDFYRAARPVAPWVMVVHGGGWNGGTPREFMSFNRRLAGQGYAVVAVSYRLAPRWRWPAQREDIETVARWVKKNAGTLGVDPGRWALLGRSAGGHIALSVAYQGGDPSLKGVVSFYAPADLAFAYQNTGEEDLLRSRGLMRNLLGGPPADVPDLDEDASPLRRVRPGIIPTLLLHGARDPVTRCVQSRRLAERLKSVGARAVFLELPWATHAFDFVPNGPGGQIAFWAVNAFLADVFREAPSG